MSPSKEHLNSEISILGIEQTFNYSLPRHILWRHMPP